MIDAYRLRLLLELSRRGTVTAVAGALGYTPSAVSQQLAALERETGARLLERAGRRVSLTPAGTVLSRYAAAVMATMEEAEAALAATRDSLAGPLRIGAFPTAARAILPAALVTLGRDHPALELRVTELDPADVPDALRTGSLDVALTSDYDYVPAEPDTAVQSRPLLEETVYLATPGTDADVGTGADAAVPVIGDFGDAPWIAGTPGSVCHALVVRACQASGFSPRIRHHADDFVTVLVLISAGQGVSLVPELGLARVPSGVTLTPLAIRRRTRVAWRAGTGGHPAIAAFTAAVSDSAAARTRYTEPSVAASSGSASVS
jgi:DNA-binding transcriptional LysR family regulator